MEILPASMHKLDILGRLTIPKVLRDLKGYKCGDRFEVYLENKKIRIKLFDPKEINLGTATISGAVYKMDILGRVTIPKPFIEVLNITQDTLIAIWIEDGMVTGQVVNNTAVE